MKDDSDDFAKRKKRLAVLIAFSALAPVIVAANWRIAAKAGCPSAFSLLTFVSPLNVVVLLAFAFQEWPIERELPLARNAANSGADAASS